MKYYCALILAVAYVVASPLPKSESPNESRILRYENENDGTGNYKFSYETSDGSKREEIGTLVNAGQSDAHIAVVGSYSFTRDDGTYETINYTADENGYVITKPDLPQMQVVQALPANVVATLLG